MTEKATGAKGAGSNQYEVRSAATTTPTATLAGMGITKNQSSNWQTLAAMSDEHFEATVKTAQQAYFAFVKKELPPREP